MPVVGIAPAFFVGGRPESGRILGIINQFS